MDSSTWLRDCGIDVDISNFVVICLHFVLFIPGLLLNITAAWISHKLETKSSLVVYLKNLVLSDLLMTLFIPLKAAEWLPGSSRTLRAFNCRFGSVLFYFCMYVSIVLMGIISLDRFFKIVQPGGKLLGQSAFLGKLVSGTVWIALLSTNVIPTMVLTKEWPVNDTEKLCMDMKSDLGVRYHYGIIMYGNVIFFVVFFIIAFCYVCILKKVIESHRNSSSNNTARTRKVKGRVFIVLAVFLVCFAPYHITRLLYVEHQVENKINCSWVSLHVAKDITLWLATTNTCLDPLIYFLLCKAFREKLFKLKIFARCISTSPQENTEDTS